MISAVGGESDFSDLTVILPTMQVDRHLMRAIDTTLSSLGPHCKLFLYLDGCFDEAECLQRTYASEIRLHFFGSHQTVGLANALNHLLSHVKTKFVARMDGDDLTPRWRFKYQIRMFDKHQLDFLFSPCFLKIEKGRGRVWWLQSMKSIPPKEIPLILLVYNPLAHPTMIAKTSTLKKLGGYRSVAMEDYDLWIRAASRDFKIMRTWLPSLTYRIHSGQTTASQSWRDQAAKEGLKEEKTALARHIFGSGATLSDSLEAAHIAVWNSSISRRLEYVGIRRALRLIRKSGVHSLFGPAPSLSALNSV